MYSPDDAEWSAFTALRSAYEAFRDNYVPLTATAMVWLFPTFILDALGVGARAQTLVEFVLGGLLLIGLAPSVAESLLGHPVPLRDCLVMSFTKQRLGALPLVLIVLLGVGGATVLLVLPGLYLLAAWSVAAPVMVAEKAGIMTSLSRSMFLTRGRIIRLMIVLVVYAVLVFFLTTGGKVAAQAIGGAGDLQWTRFISFLVDAILLALTPCLTTVLYCLLRFEKEGITLELVSDTLH